MACRRVKRCPMSQTIREMQSKTTTRWWSGSHPLAQQVWGWWDSWVGDWTLEGTCRDPIPERLGQWAWSPSPKVTTNIELQVVPFVYNMKNPAQRWCGPFFHLLWVGGSPPPAAQALLLLRFTVDKHKWTQAETQPTAFQWGCSLQVAQSGRLTHTLPLVRARSRESWARQRIF